MTVTMIDGQPALCSACGPADWAFSFGITPPAPPQQQEGGVDGQTASGQKA